jgi:DNA-binding CsgD family transcriptional regulator
MAVRAMKEGAVDFLTKPIDENDLLKSIRRPVRQYYVDSREAIERESFAARYGTLTRREREVRALLVRDFLNKQAGFELGITEYTVQVHRAHIMQKMGADSFATLIRLAARFTIEPDTGVEPRVGIKTGTAGIFIDSDELLVFVESLRAFHPFMTDRSSTPFSLH